jgi:anti-sigma factor RsiW
MSCDPHVDRLSEYLDGSLPPDDRAGLEDHLRRCEACRTLAADLRRIRDAAANLPERTPPDRVWARIALEIEHVQPAATAPAGRVRRFVRRFPSLAIPVPVLGAAVVLLAVAVGYLAWSGRGMMPGAPGGPAQGVATDSLGHPASGDLVQSVETELREAEQHYEKAIAGLEEIAKAGQGTLDPQVAATLQTNLRVIDQAIRDSRQALESQPTSQLAQESLFEAFRRKVALLQDTVALINEMRKGDQAGAAKVIGNLNKS